MHDINLYLTLSGVLTLVLWTPYIVSRLFVWGPLAFIKNYTDNFPLEEPPQPLWAKRAQRAHLNMVETMPAFIAVVIGAQYFADGAASSVTAIATWCAVFFWARVAHAVFYILGVPFVRTPIYLLSWLSILVIAANAIL